MRVETRHAPREEVTVALRWETVEISGRAVAISLTPNRQIERKAVSSGGLMQRGVEIELPLPHEERYGVYHFPGKYASVASGFRTEWYTAKP